MATQAIQKIPKGWKETTLGGIGEIIGGGTPKTKVIELKNAAQGGVL